MWVTTTILGMLFISLTSGTPRLIIPILLLLTYAWYGYKYIKSAGELIALRQARVGQLADSVYFLGFLWTLYALIDSFVIQPDVSIAEAVFRAFGYALVTTATGMLLRLFLLQFGYSEEEQVRLDKQNVEEEIAQFVNELTKGRESVEKFKKVIHNLNDSISTLKGSVDEVKNQMSDLTTRFAKLHSESLTNIEEQIKNSINDLIREIGLTEIRKQVQTEIRDEVGTLRKTISNTTRSLETATKKFVETTTVQMENLLSSIQNFSKQMTQISVPTDIVEKTIGNQVNELKNTLGESTRDVQKALTLLSEQISNIRISADIIEKTITAKLEESIGSFQEAIGSLAKQINDVHVSDDLVEKVATQKIDSSVAGVTKSISTLQGAINNLEQSVRTVTAQVSAFRPKRWWNFWK